MKTILASLILASASFAQSITHTIVVRDYETNSGLITRTVPAAPSWAQFARVSIDAGRRLNLKIENTTPDFIYPQLPISIPNLNYTKVYFHSGGTEVYDYNPFVISNYPPLPVLYPFDGTLDYLGLSSYRTSRPRESVYPFGVGYRAIYGAHQFRPFDTTFSILATTCLINTPTVDNRLSWQWDNKYTFLIRVTYY